MKRRIFLACAGVLATAMIISPQALAQKATVTARVGVIPIIGTAPLFVAQNEGWLKQGGLDLTVTTFESGPNMIQALASGTIDIYVAGVAPLAVARSKGIDVRVVAATATAENVFVASPKLAKYFTYGHVACCGVQELPRRGGQAGTTCNPACRIGSEHHPAILAVGAG